KFIQIGHGTQQAFVLMQAASSSLREGSQLLLDLATPFFGSNNHTIGAQFPFIIRERGDRDLRSAQESVPSGSASRCYATETEFQRLASQNCNNPSDGSDEPGTIEPGPRHGSRPREIVDRSRQHFCQNLCGCATPLQLLGGDVFALWS